MSLIIEDPEAEKLAMELAERTGKPVSQVVKAALRTQLARAPRRVKGTIEDALAIAHHCASLPTLDPRSPDEIIGYDEDGMWT
jgi:antitoxin VapB